MPKILRIVNRFNLGGPTYSAAYLTKHLEDRFEIKLIGGVKDDFEESSEFILNELGVSYTLVRSMKREINFKQDRIAYKEIKDIIAEFKPDIVHTHAAKAGAIGRLAAYRMDVPVIIHTFHGHVFHSYFGKIKTWVYKSVERYLAKKSSAIITLSKKQQHEICKIHKICDIRKSRIIPLGFDLVRFSQNKNEKRNQFRKRWMIDDATIAIGIVGRVVPIKNHSLFLDSFLLLKNSTKEKVRGVIIGDGDVSEDVLTYATHIGLTVSRENSKSPESDIIFTSWIKDISEANAGLDIMALTSLNEGTPVSLIEAQASNLPVVSTDVGGVRDIIIDDKSGFLCQLGDSLGISNKLKELVENKELRYKMGSVGHDYALAKFHYDRFCLEMTKVYTELLNEFEKNKKYD
ncbi:MAG: glycosyltransferase involved in cell wall biosynthesis [Parvicellaceae bacterium]